MGEDSAPPGFLNVGRVLAPRGTGGEIKVRVETDFPERFTPGRLVYVDGRPLEIESSRAYKQHILVKLATVDSIEDAEKLRDRYLGIPLAELHRLPSDEHYAFQLIGLRVTTTEGKYIGRIADIMITASNDVYVVEGERGEVLIPAIEDVVKSIDLDKGGIVIEEIEGLL